MTNIHVKIKNLRNEENYKQKQVAEYLGISQQAYSYYELDKHELPARHAVGLAKLYNVSTDYIFGVEPEPTASYDLNAAFTEDTTLKDIILNLKKLNNENKTEIVRFLSYLIRSQAGNGKKEQTKNSS